VDFYAAVLPDSGLYCIAHRVDPGNGREPFWGKPRFFMTKDSVQQYVKRYVGPDNLFLTVSTYRSGVNRQSTNAQTLQSFILDVDTNQNTGKRDPKKHDTKAEALAALNAALKATSFPAPTHVIETSAGWHVWWATDTALSPQVWKEIAARFKTFLKANFGKCAVDTSGVSNIAGVLRPPGSTHRKSGRQPFEVKLLRAKSRMPLAVFTAALDLHVPPKPAMKRARRGNTLGGCNALKPADKFLKCHAMLEYVHQQGASAEGAGYDAWWASTVMSAYIEDGEQLAHALAGLGQKYDADETQTEFEKASDKRLREQPPITCKWFAEALGIDRKTKCLGCAQRTSETASPVNCPL